MLKGLQELEEDSFLEKVELESKIKIEELELEDQKELKKFLEDQLSK